MVRISGRAAILLFMLFACVPVYAQKAPAAPDHPWDVNTSTQQVKAPPRPAPAVTLDPVKIYTLPELVDLAEHNNPDTRVSWESAKARAADLGISKSTLYPTLAAVVLANTSRSGVFFGPLFVRQTVEAYAPTLAVDYAIFDLQRSQEIAISRDQLLAANFQFNDTHRKIIFSVMDAYYRLLDTKGLQEAAEANLKNAQTVREAAEARLQNGLATLPDVLESRSAEAQADYDLQAAIGATEIAYGDLATSLGISPLTTFNVESIHDIKMPDQIVDTVEKSIDKALAQRPDLLQRVAELRATQAEVSSAKRAYAPKLTFSGQGGDVRAYGKQYPTPNTGVTSPTLQAWDAELNLSWTLFDGLARENRLAKAKADQKQAEATIDATRDQIENQVWSAYSTARTALRQQRAAAALLESATESYNAALESYNYGVRSQIDVVSAQKTLADARTADVTARTQLLTGLAALAYQTGDLLYVKSP
ncbi:MAG TPA: TolC family protein [Verrucomicrobiae bacterium]|jgi:outer membrane protein|nr:TolC family protein [Verrucomicrobiae bacterium]